MIINLCSECQIEVALVNLSNGKQESLEVIKGSTAVGAHGLPMWRHVQINRTVSFEPEMTVQVKLIPGRAGDLLRSQLAVAHVRSCPPTGVSLWIYKIVTKLIDLSKYNSITPWSLVENRCDRDRVSFVQIPSDTLAWKPSKTTATVITSGQTSRARSSFTMKMSSSIRCPTPRWVLTSVMVQSFLGNVCWNNIVGTLPYRRWLQLPRGEGGAVLFHKLQRPFWKKSGLQKYGDLRKSRLHVSIRFRRQELRTM